MYCFTHENGDMIKHTLAIFHENCISPSSWYPSFSPAPLWPGGYECKGCTIDYRRGYVLRVSVQFSSVQSLSPTLCNPPWIAAHQASLSITNSRSLLKPISIESVMPSSHLILCHPLLLLPPIPSSIRVFSSESTLHMRWLRNNTYK